MTTQRQKDIEIRRDELTGEITIALEKLDTSNMDLRAEIEEYYNMLENALNINDLEELKATIRFKINDDIY